MKYSCGSSWRISTGSLEALPRPYEGPSPVLESLGPALADEIKRVIQRGCRVNQLRKGADHMQINIDLGTYSTEGGLQLTWVPGYMLRVTSAGGEVSITANEQGLRSLAQHLLTLAEAHVPPGVHAHMEPGLELDDDSAPFVIGKVTDRIQTARPAP